MTSELFEDAIARAYLEKRRDGLADLIAEIGRGVRKCSAVSGGPIEDVTDQVLAEAHLTLDEVTRLLAGEAVPDRERAPPHIYVHVGAVGF